MGTKADFYIRKDKQMQWLASIGWDGHPESIDNPVLKATTEEEFKNQITEFIKDRDDYTLPESGWPWPWNDSRTTDYSYIFENGKVMASCFGNTLFDPLISNEEDEEEDCKKLENYFPNMKDKMNVAYGKNSGLIVISLK